MRVIISALLFLAGAVLAGYSERTVKSLAWPLPVMETGKDGVAEENIVCPLDGLANKHIKQKVELLTRLLDQTHMSSGAMLAKKRKSHNVKSLPDFQTRQTRHALSGGGTSPDKHMVTLPGGGDSTSSADQYSRDRKQAPPEEREGKAQNSPPRRNNPPGQDKQSGEGNNDQPNKDSTTTAPSPDATPEPLTITFIGQINAGKSSLANCLLGIKHFITEPVQTRSYEGDFILPGITIRALPGYGKPPLTSDRFLVKYPVKPSELVILVMGREMDKQDKTVLAGLLAGGHPPKRILLVRNKFDKAVQAVMRTQNVTEVQDRGKEVIERLKETFRNAQKDNLNDLSTVLKDPASHQHEILRQAQQVLLEDLQDKDRKQLLFVSVPDISTFNEEHDEALIQAINHRLTEQEQQVFMERLIQIRPQNLGDMNQFIEKIFRDELNHEPAATGLFTRVCNALNRFFDLPFSGTCEQWQQTFCDVFGRDFAQAVADARKEPQHQELQLEHLHRQFSAFYKGYIFGQPWYDFIRYEIAKEPDASGQTDLHQWTREGRKGWIWLRLQLARGKRADGSSDDCATALMLAAYNGHTETMLALLDRGALVNQGRTDDGGTALMLAAKNGHTGTVLALLDRGAVVNQGKTDNGTTALMIAAHYGHTETMLALLDRGAEANQGRTNDGATALIAAAYDGHTETVLALLDRGAEVNQVCTDDGATALMFAAENGFTETVLALLDRGAVVNQGKTDSGYTALMFAAQNGHTETVLALLDWGAEVNQGRTDCGYTALMATAQNGHTKTVLALLDRGAKVNQGRTDNGATVLMLAAEYGHTETVLALLDRGAEVNQGKTDDGATALMLAAEYNHTETVLTLLDRGAEVNQVCTDDGTTALMLAAKNGHTGTVLALLDRGAVVNQGNTYNGTTALMFAAYDGHAETILALLDRGALVNQSRIDNGITALMLAALGGRTEIALALLDRGAVVNQGTAHSSTTALMFAAENGHTETVLALLDRGAEVNQGRTVDGTTALMLAAKNGHTETAAQLLKSGAQFNNIARAGWGYLLKVAAIHGLTEPARQLLDRGAQPDSRDEEGFTPLHYANQHGHTETAMLLNRGALVEGRNPLADLDLNLTITLVGQPNVGKSSLANCLVGFNHFVTGLVRTIEDEGDFLFHGLRIRSLPGYGDRDALPASSFLERYPIDNNELVLMVMGDGLNGIDRIVLNGLIQQGHPPERILFVRNKFQDALQGECERNGVSPDSPEAAEMEQRLKDDLQKAHWEKLETYENRLERRGQTLAIPSVDDDHDLLFTTAEHVAFFQDEDALVRKIRSRLTTLNQRRGFNLFICLRPGKHQALLRSLEHGFRHSLSSNAPLSFQEVNNQLNSMTGLAGEIANDWLDGFNRQYKCDYDQSIQALWEKLNSVRHDFQGIIEQQPEQQTEEQPVNRSGAGDDDVIPEKPLSEGARPDDPQAETFHNFYRLLWTEASEPLPADQVWQGLTPAKRHNALELFKTLNTEIAHWARKFSVFYTVEKLGKHWYQKLGMSSNTDHPDLEVFRNWPDHALHLAVTGPTDNPDAARVLITEFGANPHNRNPLKEDSLEPVHLAAANGHNHVLGMLLSEFKISPNTESEQGYTPLHIAARTGHVDMVSMLMARSDINTLARNGCTPLHLAAAGGHTELARVLITDFGANVLAKDQNGDMPLHAAARAGHTDFARMLIDDFQVSPDVTNHHLGTPLHHAALYGHMECAKMLLAKEAKASTADRRKDNALHKAAIGGHTDIARMLIAEHGLKPNAKNKDHNRPLHFAVQGSHLECVRMLICEYNADPYKRNKKGETPIEQALRGGGYEDITNCLRVPFARIATTKDIMQVFKRSLGNRQAFNPAR